MIRITKGATNSCVFTLNEKITLSSPNLFIQIHSNQDNDDKLMWLNDDLSANTIRYNLYVIEETSSEDLNDQKISLEPTSYDYFVWQTDSATLSTTYATSIVESGKLIVTGTGSTNYTYSDKQEYTFE